jgi:CHAT domain-containing protein
MRQQEALINELVRAQLSNTNNVDLNKITTNLNSLNLELKAVKKRVSEKYPFIKTSITNLRELQLKLKVDHALMSYFFFGNKSLYHFKISENGIQLIEKPLSETFTETLSTFIDFFDSASLINNNISNFTSTSTSLYNELELSKLDNHKKLIVIPDGLLNFVPFEALLTEETTALQFSEMPFLIKKFRIGYNTNAGMYTRTSLDASKNNLLGVFPVFEGTKKELKFSINEAEDIQDEISSTILFKEKATKSNFLADAKNYNILHLSTHASGGDFVIPANIEFIDDVMLLHELYSLELHPKLVVLSACETGIGKLQKGEGAMSVARGFQYAGAKNLLFSLWKVNDLSTSQIMSSFYKNYGITESAFAANHHSKLNYLNNNNISNSKKSPYYWSSFVYYGELSEEKTGERIYLAFLLIGLLVIALWFFRKKLNFKFLHKF